MKERALEELWGRTEEAVSSLEAQVVETYITFLREVALYYLKKGRRVLFRENRVVHYGEGGFGSLIIEGDEDVMDVFGDYIMEIRFKSEIEKYSRRGHVEIKAENIRKIRYELR